MKKRKIIALLLAAFSIGRAVLPINAMEMEQTDMYMEGDEGLSEEEMKYIEEGDPHTAIADVSDVTDRRGEMVRLAIEYNQSIPFVANKGELVEEYYTYMPYRPFDRATTSYGMGYQGYIHWLYLNSFGYVPECLWEQRTILLQQEVAKDELQLGDIGIYVDTEKNAFRFGVCLGMREGKHVFTFQSPEGNLGLYTGCNRIAYLASETDDYFCKTKPVEFTRFVRPAVTWDIEQDTYEVPEMKW